MGETIANFTLLSVIGRGGYGKVFLTLHQPSHRLYALKVMKKSLVLHKKVTDSARQEKAILSLIHHPFLVTLRYAFQSATKLYLVMDYVPGGELFNRLDQSPSRRLPEAHVQFYAAEIVLALHYLHERDIIYRDLKPENVLLDRRGHVCLADFGFAKACVSGPTAANSFLGTAHAMSPEMVSGSGHGKGTDWWALGVLICELLTSKPPWSANNRAKLHELILTGPLHLPKHMTSHAKHIIQGLLKRPLDKRLGCTDAGVDAIKAHPFFHGIDWTRLAERRVKPPWVPPLRGERDVSMFDAQFTSERVQDSPSSKRMEGGGGGGLEHEDEEKERVKGFEGFSYTRSPMLHGERSQERGGGMRVGSASGFVLSSPSTTPSHHSPPGLTALSLGGGVGGGGGGGGGEGGGVSKRLMAQRAKEAELEAEEVRLDVEREKEQEKLRVKEDRKVKAKREREDKLRIEREEEERQRRQREEEFQQRQQREQEELRQQAEEEQKQKSVAAAAAAASTTSSTPARRPISQLSAQLAQRQPPSLPAPLVSSSGVKLAPWARVASPATPALTPSSSSSSFSSSSAVVSPPPRPSSTSDLTPSIPITQRLFPTLDSVTPPQSRSAKGSVSGSVSGTAAAVNPPPLSPWPRAQPAPSVLPPQFTAPAAAVTPIGAAHPSTPSSSSSGKGKTTWSRLLF